MKALFFLLDGDTNASSRHRVLQYLPYLRRGGIEPCVSRPVPERVYQRLVEASRGGLRDKATFYGLFLACRLWDVLRADRFDVVVIQRDLFPFGPPLLERLLLQRNPHLVYDTDDATYLRPKFTPRTPFQRLRRFDKVAAVASSARWISAATEPIAAWARKYNSHVSVVPMSVDLAEYERIRRTPAGERVVLGWAGTAGGLGYLHSLAPVLRDLAQKHHIVVRVISGGYRRACLPGVPMEARPWRGATVLHDMKTFDIGLVPLDDTPFEQAKFPFKLLQYLALGVPAVSARVGVATSVIRDRNNGLLARSADEWRNGLEALITDADLRQRLAIAGRETVAASYTMERVAPLLAECLWYAAR
ncbi:MAG: glycosyltransferase family 4 protein [Chloroflexi bacterium]|nr:MAG: glycosyltransferase family 4 protein [Chloroflexota bacterium]